MATYYAQASGNINAIEWDTVPTGGGTDLVWADLLVTDILVANAWTVAINVSFTCAQINTLTNSGGFTVAAAVTITAAILAGTTTCVTTSGTGYTLTVVGNVTAGSASNARGILINSAIPVNVTGNITGGTFSNTPGIYNASTGALTVVGNVTGGGGANAYGVQTVSSGALTVTGNVTGGSATSAYGIYNSSTGVSTINNGNLINTATTSAIAGKCVYNPGAINYIQYPKTAGTINYPQQLAVENVREAIVHGDVTGTLEVPAVGKVIENEPVGTPPAVGTYHEATVAEVQDGVMFGPSSAYEGTLVGGGVSLIGAGGLVG